MIDKMKSQIRPSVMLNLFQHLGVTASSSRRSASLRPSVMRSFRTWFGISLAFALFAFLFAACDAGLGESVDTMAPTVSITSPDSSAVMKGAFKISGSCVDDKAVGYVAVSITDTTTGKRVMGVNVPAFGVSWSLEVNKPVDGVYPLKDGIYSASAICFDLAGRQSGTASRVFEVDNTAPVFCLARPNSISIGDPAAYGRDVVVRGEIADDHAIKQMEIRVFKYQNNEATEITSSLNKTVFTGFETAGGTEIPIAKYFTDDSIPAADSDEYPLYLNYKAMYMDLGASVGDTVKLYVFPYLTDVAGNTSDKCYIQSSLKQLVSKACGVETTCDSLQTAQFKKILNGSYSLNELDTGTVKEILGGSYDQSQAGTDYAYYAHLAKEDPVPAENKNALAISINANNSPMYEFGGYSVDRESAKTAAGVNFAEVSSGGTMSVKVSAGLDGNEIIVNTIRVYLFACNNKLKPDAGIDLDELLKDPLKYASRADYYSDASDSSGKKVNVVDGNDVELHTLDPSVKTSNSTYKVTLPKGLPAGAYYLLLASGEDVALNGLRSDATHAFVVATTGDAPKIEFADQAYLNARLLNTDGGYSVRINITDKTDDPDAGRPGTGTLKTNGWVMVRPVLYAGHAKTLNDIDDSWAPLVEEDWTTFEGDQIKKTEKKDGSGAIIPGEYIDGEFYIDFPISRYDIKNKAELKADNYTLLLEVTAKNISAITSDSSKQIVWADNKAPELVVTAPTRTALDLKIPVNILKCDQGIDSDGKYELGGTWKDLGGAGTDRIWWSNAASPATPTVTWTTPTDFTVSISSDWNQIAGASRGESENKWNEAVAFENSWGNNLSFVAVDQAGNLTSVKTVKNVNFDFKRPVINAPAPDKYYNAVSGASGVSLEFTITDDYKITAGKIIDSEGNEVDAVRVTAKKDGAVVANKTNGYSCSIAQSKKDDGQGGLVDDPQSVTVKIEVKTNASVASVDGKWDFSVTATDVYDRFALPADDRYAESRAETKSFGFTIDTAAPASVGGITIGESGSVADWQKSKYLSISGKFAEMTSGLDKVYYRVNGGSELSETIGGKTGAEIPFSFSPAGFEEGSSNTIVIRAQDLAGNASGANTYTIKIDTSAPLVSTSHYILTNATKVDDVTQVDNLDEMAGTILINDNYSIVVYGTLEENASGMESMNFVLPAVMEEGKPKVVSTGWKPYVYYLPASGIAVAGTVYCEKTSSGYVQKTTVNPGDDVTGLYVRVDNGFIALIDKAKVPNGVLDVNVNAVDKAGNKTDERKFGISKDTTPPEISIGSPKESATLNGDVTFRGSVEDMSLKSVKAYWSYDSSATIDESGATPRDHEIAGLSGTYSWSVTQAVTKVVGGSVKCADGVTDFDKTAHSTIYLKIKADDKAGNETVKAFAFNVDPNTDRPEIDLADYIDASDGNKAPKAQTSDPDHYWFVTKDKTIKGSVSDDDGLSGLKLYYYDRYEDPDATGSISWTELTVSNGSFALTLPAATTKDGPHEIMFKIVDAKGTSFITKAPAATTTYKDFYLSPKINLNKKTLENSDNSYTNLYLTIDSANPTYSNVKYATKDAAGSYSAESDKLGKVGGKKKFIQITFDAQDANGIDKVEFVLNGGAAGTATTTKQDDKYKCVIKDIDVSSLPTGDYSAKFTIIGKAKDKIEYSFTISVDNTAPTVYNFAPKTDAAKPSSGDITVRGEIDNADSLSYAMTYGSETSAPASYADITFANQKWSVTFDNQVDPNHDKTIEEYVKAWNKPETCVSGEILTPVVRDASGQIVTDNIANYKFDAIVSVKIWVKAEDDVGNESITSHVFKFDPQGGRPELHFSYPENNAVKDGGNNITIRGDATDDQGVKAVFLQIISTTHRSEIYSGSSYGSATYDSAKDDVTAFNLTANDLNYLKAAGYKVIRMKAYPAKQEEWAGSGVPSEYGILTTLKSIWSQKINEKDEFSPIKGDAVTSNPLYIKALAFDGQKLSVPKYRRFVIDNDKPTISKIFLRRYSGSTKIASREYSNGVYLKGDGSDWKLGFTLEDNQGLANYRIGTSATSADEAKDNAEAATKTTISGEPKTFATSVSLDSAKKFIHIMFEDITQYENEYAFAINYDSVDPVVKDPSFVNNGTEKKIYNDNGKYSVGATVVDDDSRFDKLVVYYMRNDNTVFDPMFPKAKQANGTYKHSYSVGTGSGAVYEDGLYWFKQTVTRDASNLSVLTLSADPNEHIHKGRLVKIGGAVYTIKNVDGKNIVLDGNVEADWTEAMFNYGIVIDNTTQESESGTEKGAGPYGYKYPKNITSDDGDGMVEYAQDVGDFMLEAELNSKNIPDGPINVYYVAYDRAGNCSALGSVTGATVSNNAPRLANVTVASDFNFDDVYNAGDYVKNADGESRAYYETSKAYEDADTAVTLGGASDPWIAAKGTVKVSPEVLGGNGSLTWAWTYPKGGVQTAGVGGTLSTDSPTEESEYKDRKRAVNAIMLPEDTLGTADADCGDYNITISDQTDGVAQKATIKLYLQNDVNDGKKPIGKTKRFFWKTLTNNSVYGSSAVKTLAELKGHIDLEKSGETADGDASKTTNTQPKVSGKIVLKGTAFDNVAVKTLTVTVPGFKGASNLSVTATRTFGSTGAWTGADQGGLDTDGYHFVLDTASERFNNAGHYVSWTLELDTQKYGGGNTPAANNVKFALSVNDKKGNASVESAGKVKVYANKKQAEAGKYYADKRFAEKDTSSSFARADYSADEFSDAPATLATAVAEYELTPVSSAYTMDIVPYITRVETSLSGVNATNGVTDRSSLGAYPVYIYKNSTATPTILSTTSGDVNASETVKIYGFNLKGSVYNKGTATNYASYKTGAGKDWIEIDSKNLESGDFALSVNGVDTINNSNNDNARGSYAKKSSLDGGEYDVYKNYYNRQANNANNNNLTDNVAFDVWQLNNMAAAPMSETADDPQMKIKPLDSSDTQGRIGFAFSNGSSAFAMPNTTHSWTYWAYDYDRVRYVGLNYDPQGYAWAAATGQDTFGSGGDPFFMETTRNRETGGHRVQGVTQDSKWKLERISIYETNEGDYSRIMQDRIQSPAFANTKKGVYLAYYYVGLTKAEIRFRAGTSASANAGNAFDMFQNDGTLGVVGNNGNAKYTTANVQLLAGGTGAAAKNAAPYVSLAAVDGKDHIDEDVVVIVWYDGSKMIYGYLKDPLEKDGQDKIKIRGNKTAAGWTFIDNIFPAGVGEYCKIATDQLGGIHIAAYDTNNADVYYAYMSKYNETAKTGKVDSYDATGFYLTLDAALEPDSDHSGAGVLPAPQIGFYSTVGNRPKYARWNTGKEGSIAAASDLSGVDSNDSFTGRWEVVNVPTISSVRKDDTTNGVKQNINVCVWKSPDGNMAKSTTGDSVCIGSATGGTSGTSANNYGDVYGNGTANAVLGYTYGNGTAAFIETAQRTGVYKK